MPKVRLLNPDLIKRDKERINFFRFVCSQTISIKNLVWKYLSGEIYSWKKREWKTRYGKPVQNLDLWKSLDKEAQRHSIDWRWIKGHSGHRANDICDALAKSAAKCPTEHDIEYEKRDQF